MRLDIDGVRPALLDRELAARIDELRSFRHVFRNIYQTELDPKRIELVQQQLDPTIASFEKAHKEFLKKLKSNRFTGRGLIRRRPALLLRFPIPRTGFDHPSAVDRPIPLGSLRLGPLQFLLRIRKDINSNRKPVWQIF